MTDRIDVLLEEILVDANGDDEQLAAFEQAFATAARFPFPARVVGVSIEVTDVRYDGDSRRGLVAICSRDGEQHRVSLADVVPEPLTVKTSTLLDAYRRCAGWNQPPRRRRHPSPSSLGSTGRLPRPR